MGVHWGFSFAGHRLQGGVSRGSVNVHRWTFWSLPIYSQVFSSVAYFIFFVPVVPQSFTTIQVKTELIVY